MCSFGDGNVVSLLRLSLENKDKNYEQEVKTKKKHVRFSNVEIREYALVVGDHPYCVDGLALSLDWRYSADTTVREVIEKAPSRPQRLGYCQRRLRLQQASRETQEMQTFLENERIRSTMSFGVTDSALELNPFFLRKGTSAVFLSQYRYHSRNAAMT
jgi:hypothetical protein